MHRVFFVFAAGFAGGIALRSFIDLGVSFLLFFTVLGALLAAFRFVIPSAVPAAPTPNAGKNAGAFFIAGIVFLAAGLGMLRYDVADANRGSPELRAQVGEEVVLCGVIADEPDVREGHTKLVVKPTSVGASGPPENGSISFDISKGSQCGSRTFDISKGRDMGKILIVAEHYPEFSYGDEVEILGRLLLPENFADGEDGGRTFDYIAWLAKDGIFYQMFYPDIRLLAENRGNPVKAALFSLKARLLKNVSRVIPEPHASLLGGITLGTKQALGAELLDDFRKTGIIHIVVLSGYNITIVAEAVGRFASFLPRAAGLSLSVSVIAAFAVMVGGGATIVRASLMALLILLARATGRIYEITIALVAAGFFMLLWNPKILVFDPSFQLSFLATVGLIHLAPRIERFFGWMPTKLQLREFATATVATQLFVLPLLLSMTGELSLVSVPVNLLILPAVPATMFFGLLASVAGFLGEIASLPFAYISYALLAFELAVVDFFADLPFASAALGFPPGWGIVLAYAFFAAVLLRGGFFRRDSAYAG